MLSEEEETKLEMFFRIIQAAKDDQKFPLLGTYDIEWLTEKLKETNNELSKVHLELQKANEELARLHEVYGA